MHQLVDVVIKKQGNLFIVAKSLIRNTQIFLIQFLVLMPDDKTKMLRRQKFNRNSYPNQLILFAMWTIYNLLNAQTNYVQEDQLTSKHTIYISFDSLAWAL